MSDCCSLQDKIYRGYGKVADHIGTPFQQYRVTGAATPAIASSNLRQTLQASFNVQDMAYKKPSTYGKALWYCVANGEQIQPGDYFVGGGLTYFIGAMEPLLPIFAVLCECVVKLYRPQKSSGVGLGAYGGNTELNQTQYINQFPASLLATGRVAKAITNLPGDASSGWKILLLPMIPDVQIKPWDVMTDDLSRRYIVAWAELAEHGWRCGVIEAET